MRQKNQTAIEVLRGTMQQDLESLKSSLEVSRAATRVLIDRRIQYYEQYFKTYHALDDAVSDLRVAFQHTVGADREELLVKARQTFYAANDQFLSWEAIGAAFVPPGVDLAVSKLYQTISSLAKAAQESDSKTVEEKAREAIECEVGVEKMIRDDLRSIRQSGGLDYD